jgi:prepilin-type N-terminal cleavage/methylation domain-containing protein
MVLNNIKSRNKERGFTIVELLIVIVVIGILAGITIVAYSGITNRANQSKIVGNANSVQSVAEAFNADKGYYPGLAATGTDALALGSASTQVPTGVTIIPEVTGTSAITSASGTSTIAYSCFPACGGKTATGGRLTYWDPVAGTVKYIYLGNAASGSVFTYPAS